MKRIGSSTLIAAALCAIIVFLVSSSASASIIYVKWDSPGSGTPPVCDGTTWGTAFHKVQDGLNAALSGDEVWVAGDSAHPYYERITLKTGVGLYGGFAGVETSRTERNWNTNVTILDGQAGGAVVTSPSGATYATIIDGFTIRNALYDGIACSSSSPTVANNYITGIDEDGIGCYNSSSVIRGNTVVRNGSDGIECNWSSPVVVGNTLSDNHGCGVVCCVCTDATVIAGNTICGNTLDGVLSYSQGSQTSPTIEGNVIGSNGQCGVQCLSNCTAIIRRNVVSMNKRYGVRCVQASPVIAGNLIVCNTQYGVYCYDRSSPVIANNTIIGQSRDVSVGVRSYSRSSPVVSNTVIAVNSIGISDDGTGYPVSRSNCLYDNLLDYSGLSPGTSDISADPVFMNRDAGDYHLLAVSPCIDAGTSTDAPPTDFDGFIRPQDGNGDGTAICDIGAYEFPLNPSLAKKNYADGVSLAFGSSAVTAKFAGLGCTYVENLDRSSGVRVDTAETLADSALVNVQGTMQTDSATGERYVQALPGWPKPTGGLKTLRPLMLPGKSIGGGQNGLQAGVWGKQYAEVPEDGFTLQWIQAEGLNNIGLLVTIFGKVRYAGTGEFWIDDGSELNDDSGHIGVKVIGPPPTPDPVGKYVKVTGISSCEKTGSDLVRLIRALEVAEVH